MGVCILDMMIDSIRLKYLQRMLKGYRPGTVAVSFVLEELGFDEVEIGIEFLKRLGCVLQEKTVATEEVDATASSVTTKEWIWNTKDSNIDPAALFTQEKLLL